MTRILVIGAGVGGLACAALLAKAGLEVTVLEAHVYPGGCAGTFYHQGYRFEAGATLAGGFYPGGPMDLLAREVGIEAWPAHPDELAMLAHLPGGKQVSRWGDDRRSSAYAAAFGPQVQHFWDWQESRAEAMWQLALRLPSWPPQSAPQLARLAGTGLGWLAQAPQNRLSPGLILDAFRPVSAHLRGLPDDFRLFIDGQLLIAAQTTSQYANALYGASALDLPRRGIVHLEGGIGVIAELLAAAVRRHGGQVLYRSEVTKIVLSKGRPLGVELRRGGSLAADRVIANLPPWNLARLLGEAAPARLQHLPARPATGWGAFMAYVGLDAGVVPQDFPLHHQVICREPLGEGNTIFLSLSPAWDHTRAPAGRRALTISTHTDLHPWWDLFEKDRPAYQARKQQYVERVLQAAEIALPGLRQAAELVLPGTPVTFQRFTRRDWGWVGGFPQTNLFLAWPPRLAPGLWLVGDSIFPGQSTAAVALGGLRIAKDVLQSLGASPKA